jgi:EmrB/QacA subfamily drug resistance transporter
MALFMAAMEMTVVSTAMPTVVAELHGALHYAWVFTAYMLASTITLPISGKLADLHGRKPVMFVAMALFLFGSMASGQAHTMTQLIVFRAIQGVGAGGVQPMAITIVGDIFKIEERAKMQGVFGAVWAIAGLAGPLLGGVIVATLSWRWVFYVNVPFGLLSAAVLSFSLVESVEKRPQRLDIAGALLLAGAVIALLLGTDGHAPAVLLPASALLTVAFLFVETRAEAPILPLKLFAQRIIATSSALSALSGGAMLGLVTFVPLYAQGVLGATPTEAGSTIAAMAVAWPVASAISGRLIAKVGFRVLVRFGLFLVAASSVWLTFAMAHGASAGTVRIGSALLGLGMGFANTPLVIAVQTSVSFSQRGVATASTMFFRNIGGTVAVGVMGVILARALLAGAARGDLRRSRGRPHPGDGPRERARDRRSARRVALPARRREGPRGAVGSKGPASCELTPASSRASCAPARGARRRSPHRTSGGRIRRARRASRR